MVEGHETTAAEGLAYIGFLIAGFVAPLGAPWIALRILGTKAARIAACFCIALVALVALLGAWTFYGAIYPQPDEPLCGGGCASGFFFGGVLSMVWGGVVILSSLILLGRLDVGAKPEH